MAITFVYDFEATKAALLYLVSKGLPSFDKHKALTLLFLADRAHLLRFGRTITGDSYVLSADGPIPLETARFLGGLQGEGTKVGTSEVKDLAELFELTNDEHPQHLLKVPFDKDALSESDLVILDQVASEHGGKTFDELYEETHATAAYANVWKGEESFPMSFEDFFIDAPEAKLVLDEILRRERLIMAFPDPVSA